MSAACMKQGFDGGLVCLTCQSLTECQKELQPGPDALTFLVRAKGARPSCFGGRLAIAAGLPVCSWCSHRTECEREVSRKSAEQVAKALDREVMKQGEADPNGKALNEPGAKADAGKQLAGVLLDFSRALGAVADVGTMGARKYSRGGWMEVQNAETRYMDAMLRHLLKHGAGETHDPESGFEHLAHAAWNVLAILELRGRAQGGAAC